MARLQESLTRAVCMIGFAVALGSAPIAAAQDGEVSPVQTLDKDAARAAAEAAKASGPAEPAAKQEAPQEEAGDLDALLSRMFRFGSSTEGGELDALIEQASEHPLGARENPVRAQGPAGQRAYLSRLRCSDLSRPAFFRRGSAGMSPYGNIVDLYSVSCDNAEPSENDIYIDMYHAGHVEREAVPGYGIVGGRPGE